MQTKNSWFRDVTDTASRSWLGAPLLSNDGLLGVITVARRVPGAYSDEEVEMVNMLASQAAIAVHKANLLNQLQGAKSRYTHLFEESSDLILIMDPQGLILDANRKACHMLRRPKDAMIGSDLALLGLNLRETFKKQATELARRKEITTELTIMDAYRQEIPVEITAKQVEIESRSVIQWVGRDLTARRQLAQMRQDLTQMIVHDLRGPMGTLLGAVELLPYLIKAEASQDGVTKALELLQVALHTGQTLRDLVDSMLDLTKLEQGSFPLRVGPVNMQELFMEVEKQVTPLAAAKETQLTFEPVAANLTFDLDGSVIRRVLVNLVDNAIKYTPPGGEVEIKVLVDGDKLTFKVIDNGPGVSPEKHQEIFDKFSRVDHQAKIQGVGLGLAFCKMAIEAHYGQIWIESELNVGSTFIVEIPLNLA
ncbi:MAG TPA: GAF domain-containing sensor histidine kinase, partial [Anaerolineae bacterium]|nr:GAF domain-containing sensor histidine kinase [Anaerolineae bacterium]